eukprot:g24231.t1
MRVLKMSCEPLVLLERRNTSVPSQTPSSKTDAQARPFLCNSTGSTSLQLLTGSRIPQIILPQAICFGRHRKAKSGKFPRKLY